MQSNPTYKKILSELFLELFHNLRYTVKYYIYDIDTYKVSNSIKKTIMFSNKLLLRYNFHFSYCHTNSLIKL